MNFAKRVFNFYINSSIHVALSVFSLAWITLIEFGISYSENILYFIFYASITGYNFVKYFGIAKFHHRQLAAWLKLIQITSFLSFILMCYYGFLLSFNTLIFIGSFAILTFLYAIPFLSNGERSLRHIEGLKVYIIALVWTGITVFIPLINDDYVIDVDVLVTGIQRFIFIFVLMLPFEIRDLKYDSLKLSTIPQKTGVKQTKRIGTVLLLLCFLLEFFKDETNILQIVALATVLILTLFFLLFSRIEQGKYYSSFWVEGLPIIWLVISLY